MPVSSRMTPPSLPPNPHPPTPTPGAREGVKGRREGKEGRRVRWLGMGRGAASRGSPRAARRACKVAESERRVKNCTCMLLASQLASAWKIVSRRDEIVTASTPNRSSKRRLKDDVRRENVLEEDGHEVAALLVVLVVVVARGRASRRTCSRSHMKLCSATPAARSQTARAT